MSAIFGLTFDIGRMTEVLTPDIYRAHCPYFSIPRHYRYDLYLIYFNRQVMREGSAGKKVTVALQSFCPRGQLLLYTCLI